MARKYPNDCIAEASCEFRFAMTGGPSRESIERAVEALEASYPVKRPITQKTHRVQFEERSFHYDEVVSEPGFQLATEDGRNLVRLTPDVQTVHRLAPYDHWERFGPRIREAWEALGNEPVEIQQLGLRYINRFEVKHTESVERLFRAYPTIPVRPSERLGAYMVRADYIDPETDNKVLIVQTGTVPGPSGHAVIFDLLRVDLAPGKTWSEVETQLHEAHARIVEAFENFITDDLRREYLGGLLSKEDHLGAA